MIELGVREFRERFSEVINGRDFIVVTNNGREVGTYLPFAWKPEVAAARGAASALAAAQDELRAKGVDLDAEMAKLGMTPMGEPLDDA
jgi:hypothetical protein